MLTKYLVRHFIDGIVRHSFGEPLQTFGFGRMS